jgi:truncated hemoglobin YjbI
MSKFVLQAKAFETSGVTVLESEEASKLEPSLYSRFGEDGFIELSTLFYNRVFEDNDAPWFLNIFASSSKAEAIENQYRFFVQVFGGPDLYRYVLVIREVMPEQLVHVH